MRGMLDITKVRTKADYEVLTDSDKIKFKTLLKGTIYKQKDIAEYPKDYDYDLRDGDDGYIAPILEDFEDLSIINHFDFKKTDLEEY